VTIEEGDMDYNAALDKFAKILSGDPGSNPIRGWLIRLSVVVFKSLATCYYLLSSMYCPAAVHNQLSFKAFLLVCVLFSSPVFLHHYAYSYRLLARLTPVIYFSNRHS